MVSKSFFESGEKIYFIDYPETIKEGLFSEYWDYDESYVKCGAETIKIETCRIFKNKENAKAYLREQKIHRKFFIKEEIKRLTKELDSL